MAVQTSQTTAAAAATTSGAPAAGSGTASDTSSQSTRELTLEEALRLDLAGDAKDESSAGKGTKKGATSPDDDEPEGDEPEGDEPEGDEPEGDEPEGDEPEGDEPEKDENDDDDTPPKGLEALPKWAQKRISKQSDSIRKLKEQVATGGITLAANPLTPLAHVSDQAGLTKEIQKAKTVRQLLGKLTDADFTEGSDGQLQAEVQVGNQKYVFTQDDVAARLAFAEAVLDPEVHGARKEFIQERTQNKPWEAADKVVPGVLIKDTPENKAYLSLLEQCPEFAARVPNYEFVLACAIKGMRQFEEETAGKAKWQRFALDKDGKIIPPKRKAGEKDKENKARTTTAAAPPANQRPPMRPTGAKAKTTDLDALQARAEAGDADARRELLQLEAMA